MRASNWKAKAEYRQRNKWWIKPKNYWLVYVWLPLKDFINTRINKITEQLKKYR